MASISELGVNIADRIAIVTTEKEQTISDPISGTSRRWYILDSTPAPDTNIVILFGRIVDRDELKKTWDVQIERLDGKTLFPQMPLPGEGKVITLFDQASTHCLREDGTGNPMLQEQLKQAGITFVTNESTSQEPRYTVQRRENAV